MKVITFGGLSPMTLIMSKAKSGVMAALLLPFIALCAEADTDTDAYQTSFEGLDRELTAEQQKAAGLDQLTPEQLRFLNDWLKGRFSGRNTAITSESSSNSALASDRSLAGSAPVPVALTAEEAAAREAAINAEVERRIAAEVAAARREREADEQAEEDNEPFEAVIRGDFRGWSGNTVFALDNGQVWRQRHGSNYRHTQGEAKVRFEQNFFGLWEMTVLSSGRTTGVRRID